MITVVTRLTFPPEMSNQIDTITTKSVEIFKQLPGFISIEINKSLEGNATCSYLQWQTIEHHEGCMQSELWADLNPEWDSIMAREDVDFQFIFIGKPEWN